MTERVYTESIPVLRGHLEELYEALDVALGHQVATDLAQQYRNVGGTSRASNLTVRLEKAVARAEGYLAVEDDDELSQE